MCKAVYEKRVVTFIDILGYKNIIKETEKDNVQAVKLLEVMNSISEEQKRNYEGDFSQSTIGKEISIFSDSIVISYPIQLGGSLFYILMDLIYLQMELICKSILFRGAVVIGDLYHDRNIIFGPAMVKAYELESEKAIYPRIIIEKNTIGEGIKFKASQNTYEYEAEYILSLLRKDYDGYYFLDYMRQYQELDDYSDYYVMLYSVRKMICSALIDIKDRKILKKYKWLREYYNLTLEDVKFKGYREFKIPKTNELKINAKV